MVVQKPSSLWIVCSCFLIGIIVFLFKIFVRIVYKNTNCTHLSHLFLYFKILWHMKCLIFIFILFSPLWLLSLFVVVIRNSFSLTSSEVKLSNCQSPCFPSQPLLPHVLTRGQPLNSTRPAPLGLGSFYSFKDETDFFFCYGLNYCPLCFTLLVSKFICWSPNPYYFRMWLFLEKRTFKEIIKLKLGHWGDSLSFMTVSLLERRLEHGRTRRKTTWWHSEQ